MHIILYGITELGSLDPLAIFNSEDYYIEATEHEIKIFDCGDHLIFSESSKYFCAVKI